MDSNEPTSANNATQDTNSASEVPSAYQPPTISPSQENQVPPVSNPPGGSSSVKLKNVDPKLLRFFEHDPDEKLIFQLNKHTVGLVFIYAGAIIMFVLIILAVFLIFRYIPTAGFDIEPYELPIKMLFGVTAFLVLLGGYIAGWVYQRSCLILTSEKLIQIYQKSLFNREVSQLSIGDVQDTNVDQMGILSRIFHFGTIVIETAGEQHNFQFNYAPYPHEHSKEITAAHERNIHLYGN